MTRYLEHQAEGRHIGGAANTKLIGIGLLDSHWRPLCGPTGAFEGGNREKTVPHEEENQNYAPCHNSIKKIAKYTKSTLN